MNEDKTTIIMELDLSDLGYIIYDKISKQMKKYNNFKFESEVRATIRDLLEERIKKEVDEVGIQELLKESIIRYLHRFPLREMVKDLKARSKK